MDTFELLKELTEIPGPSGSESSIAKKIADIWQPFIGDAKVDRIGNLIAVREGSGQSPRPQLLLAAHMDEIALMVKHIEDQHGHGYIRVTRIGGVDNRHLYGQQVIVHGTEDLKGVIGALPALTLPENRNKKSYELGDYVVDVGLSHDELTAKVSIGDFVSFRQPLRKLSGRYVTGKALDNRAAVAAVTRCLEYLQGRQHSWDVVAVATAQEENGLIGAYTSAFSQYPDAAIAIDVTFGRGSGASGPNTFKLGEGPVLNVGPNVHKGMTKGLEEAAEALEMDIRIATHTRRSGTDAFGLQVARDGIPIGLVEIPLRNMHTMVETIHSDDIDRVGRLLGEFIYRLDGDFLDGLGRQMLDIGDDE